MKRKFLVILGLTLLILPLSVRAAWTTQRLTYNSGWSEKPDIAVDSNNHLHSVWNDNSPGNWEIYYKKSTDGGANWTTKRLTHSLNNSTYPNIALDSNDHLHVVWQDFSPGNSEIFYQNSTDGGVNWTTKRLTFNPGSSTSPNIALDSNDHLHVVWNDNSPGNNEIHYKKSTDGGTTWITKRLTYNSGYSTSPNIAADSNDHLHVVWDDNSPGNSEIYFKKSTDGGSNWTTKRLTYNSGSSYFASLAIGFNNHLHVVWSNVTGNHEIYYKRSTDSGANWTTKRLTYNSGFSIYPDIAVDSNGNPHVVWCDNTPGNNEILYKRSTDGWTTWIAERLTFNSGDSIHPAIASNKQIHILWEDDSPGNYEIYYKQK